MSVLPCKSIALLEIGFQQQTALYANCRVTDLVNLRYPKRQVVVVTDHHLVALHPDIFAAFDQVLVLENGEAAKTFQQLEYAIQQLIHFQAHRKTILFGVGGGAVTDFTGLLASLFMRGIEFGFIPTTILGAVDASIGGKNGINVGPYKNYVGTIHQPAFVAIDPRFFATLPEREFVNGFSEVIKYACLYDATFFEFLENHQLQDFRQDEGLLNDVLQQCIQYKAQVVQKDAFEKGERKILNFGHTLGHAVELATNLPHGFAVAIGMNYAAQLSVHLGYLPKSDVRRIQQLLQRYHLPVNTTESLEDLWPTLLKDKKQALGKIDFILLEAIGSAKIEQLTTADLFKELKNVGL